MSFRGDKDHSHKLLSVCSLRKKLTMQMGVKVEPRLAVSASTLNPTALGRVLPSPSLFWDIMCLSVCIWTSVEICSIQMCEFVCACFLQFSLEYLGKESLKDIKTQPSINPLAGLFYILDSV